VRNPGQSAYETVVRQALAHADALYNFARYLVRDAGEAEDLVQETYAKALGAVHRFQPGTDLKSGCFGSSATHTSIDCVASHKKPSRRQAETKPLRARTRNSRSNPGQLRALVARDVAKAVEELPSAFREIILLDLEGFTEKEIADVLDCAQGTVKSRLSRARAELRRVLKAYAP